MRFKLPPIKVFHARLMPLALLSLVAGLLCIAVDVWWLTATLMFLVAAVIVALTVVRRRRYGVGIACLVCLLLSCVVFAYMGFYRTATVGAESLYEVEVYGRVASVSADENGKIDSMVIDRLTVDGIGRYGKAKVDLRAEETSVMGFVYYDSQGTDYVVGVPVRIGDTVKITGDVRRIAWRYLKSENMHSIARGVYFKVSAATCAVEEAPLRLTASEKVRTALYRTLRANMSGQSAGMAYAFLTGDNSLVPPDVSYGYRSTGVAHLLAVSGLHVGVLVGVLAWILKRLRCPTWGKTLVYAVVLGVYAWLCGGTPSVVRATVVTVSYSLCATLGVHRDRPSILATAGLLLLLVDPLWLYDVSFLLSYAAFSGIVLLYPQVRRIFGRVKGRWGDALALNVAVTVSTAPLSIYFFGGISVVTIPLNFLLIPVMSVVYVALFALAIVSAVPTWGILLTGVDYVLRVVNGTVIAIGRWGYLPCKVSVWQLPLFYAAVGLASPYCILRDKTRYAVAGVTAGALGLWTLLSSLA